MFPKRRLKRRRTIKMKWTSRKFWICVAAFLADRIKFTDMPRIIERAMQSANFCIKPTLDDYIATDAEIRKMTSNWI